MNRIWSLLVVVQVLATGMCVAQLEDAADITGAGARAEGLGGAFIGVADDATALVWNPAGLTQLERPEASVVIRQVFGSFDYDDDLVSFSSTSKHFLFNFASIAYPINLEKFKMTFAVAYQNQVDLYQYSKGSIDAGFGREEATGGVNTISPGLGVRLLPILSIGATANIWHGSSDYEITDLSTDESYGYDDTWSGFNMQFGTMLDFSSLERPIPLRIGATYRMPFDMKDKWDDTDGDAGTWNWEYPTMIGVGTSYRIGENLTLAADYEMRMFGKSKIRKSGEEDDDFSKSGDDLNSLRVGAEYLIVSGAGVFPIRAGFKTGGRLRANITDNNEWGDQVTSSAISIGTGYIHKRFAIDAAFTIESYDWKSGFEAWKRTFSTKTLSISSIYYF